MRWDFSSPERSSRRLHRSCVIRRFPISREDRMKVALVLLAVILSGWRLQAAQLTEGSKIDNVQIRGNRRIQSDTIKYHIQTKPGGVLNMATIRRDVKELY